MSVEPVPSIGTGRCGCASDECTCDIQGSNTVTVGGDGSAADPYTFEIDAEIGVTIVDTATVNLTRTGAGTPADPYLITGVATPAGVQVDVFTSDDTYPVPSTASMLSFKCVAGGGGAGGAQVGTLVEVHGGGGGAGGGVTEVLVPTADLGPTLTVTVGLGGNGGAGAVIGGGGGTDGTSGTDSLVEDGSTVLCSAGGGERGGKGLTGGNGGVGDDATILGGDGADADSSGPAANAARTCLSPSGGGAGASLSATAIPRAPSDGGDVTCLGITGAAAGSGANGANGTDFAGGGGGDNGFDGGNGGLGAGGGGGGAGTTGVVAGGDGGDGGDGYVQITAW